MSAADLLNARPEPATLVINNDPPTVTQRDYVTLIDLALGNPVRSHLQQAVLEVHCERITNVFCDWLQQARDTWRGCPCEGCGAEIMRHGPDRCERCRREAAEDYEAQTGWPF